jgi:competence protein ComEA
MLHRLVRLARDTFGFTPAQARGFLLLVGILTLLLLAPFLWDFVPDEPVPSAADQRQLDEWAAELEVESAQERAQRYPDRPATPTPDRLGVPPAPVRRFAFDPNVITAAEWQELGLPRWLAERIVRYRAKGGRFRRKEDLLRIYDFPETTYRDLEPYIELTTPEAARPVFSETPSGAPAPVTAPAPREVPRPARLAIDLNAADTTELKRVYGIGSKLSARIVRYRESLGGFAHPGQVREVWGLDSTVVDELLRYATLGTPRPAETEREYRPGRPASAPVPQV